MREAVGFFLTSESNKNLFIFEVGKSYASSSKQKRRQIRTETRYKPKET